MSASTLPTVSVLMPARDAAATIGAAVASLRAQSYGRWELLIIADDGADYAAILRDAAIEDSRISHLRTTASGSGPAAARNLGLRKAAGEVIAALDADDDWAADRLAGLVTLTMRYGLATDNTGVFDASDRFMHAAFSGPVPSQLNANAILDCGVPLFPVCRRELACDGWPEVPFAEDALFNLMLLEKAGTYVLHPNSLYHYRVRRDSMSHRAYAWRHADAAYGEIIAGLETGHWLRDSKLREAAGAGFAAKRKLNREFGEAREAGPASTFQAFLAQRRNAG